jgi:CelD/BcsL family acetyltransferase involved in cellulose biosynthesis
LALEFQLQGAGDLPALGRDWQALESRAEGSFFQSWAWVGTWLAAIPEGERPGVLAVRCGTDIVGLGVLGRRTVTRHGFVVSHGLYLTQTGRGNHDGVTVEYNGILADKSCAAEVTAAAVSYLVRHVPGWDELFLSGVREGEFESAAHDAGLSLHLINRSPSRYVDLAALRTKGGVYLDTLGKNTRYSIRRSKRRYEERGKLAFDVARDVPTALAYFAEMKALHQAAWTARGETGSFANPFFEVFHRALIEAYVPTGEVQLARIAAGDLTVGVLYNFAWRGRVCNYQAGLAYESDNAIKPGLVSHELAIVHALAAGASVYDFLAGDVQYKQSLANGANTLVWLAARKPRLKYRVEEALRTLKNRVSPPPSRSDEKKED